MGGGLAAYLTHGPPKPTPIGSSIKVIDKPADRLREQTKFGQLKARVDPRLHCPKWHTTKRLKCRGVRLPRRSSPTERIRANMQLRPEATREEMRDAKLPLAYRDSCANLLIPLNRCRFETFYLPWKCEVGLPSTAVQSSLPVHTDQWQPGRDLAQGSTDRR